jgi:hypothetical protein
VTKLIRLADRHLWTVPVGVFLLAELAFSIWSAVSRRPVLLSAAPLTSRQQVYSSLTGSSSALLGLALAAVAILAAYGPRPTQTGLESRRESTLTRARVTVVGSLLATSAFLLVILVTTTTAIAVDTKSTGNAAISTLLEAASLASIMGLLLSGIGLALAVVERSRA